ncbi:hypothetical protein DSL64_26780 [Dyadobacter luteus]|uniref:histidine kinase n=1 Tax=Dyadobacter luteus TaxID=2259619 RepID=A0A3D8Y4N3_9BACT|nr:ATP-binding protein [Dyadobacter luteus]REA56525.1 hypothetical protein DSL64_26780 [Dyadobacter luteus]
MSIATNHQLRNALCSFLTIFIVSCQTAIAKTLPKYSLKHYTAENGLPQNTIKSIAADSDGFLWLTTEDGLVRFDGRRFHTFDKQSTGVKSKRATYIRPARKNLSNSSRLDIAYAYFANNEICRIQNGAVFPVTDLPSETGSQISKILAEEGELFIITGLPLPWDRAPAPEMPVFITNNSMGGNFYLCTSSTVSHYQKWKKRYEVKNATTQRLNYFVLADQLYHFDGKKSFVRIFEGKRTTFDLAGDILKSQSYPNPQKTIKLYWNNNSDQAYLYLDGQLFSFVQHADGTLTTRLELDNFDFIAQSIDVVYFDTVSRKFFLGSGINGLFVLSMHQFETISIGGSGRPNVFYAQLAYDHNSILTPTGTIVGKIPENDKLIDSHLSAIKRLNGTDKRVIFRDKQETVWIKDGPTLTRFNKQQQITYQWKFRSEVKAIRQINESEFLIGVINKGLYKLNTNAPLSEPQLVEGRLSQSVTWLSPRNATQAWVGTETGLYIFNYSSKKMTLVEETAGLYIKSIEPYQQSLFWITANDKGLMMIDKDNRLVSFPLDKNGYLASAHCTVNDSLGYLWITTNRGLFQMKISDLLWYAFKHKNQGWHDTPEYSSPIPYYGYYSMEDGFATNEFNGSCSPCAVKLANGYVSLPSLNGLVWFKPEHININQPSDKIVLDWVQVENKNVQKSGDTIRLPLRPENIKLRFASAYNGNPNNLSISYKLVRSDQDESAVSWQPVEEDDNGILLRYNSLSSDSYTLLVRKQTGFGLNSYTTKSIYLIVPNSWYENGWIILVFIIIFLIGIIFITSFINKRRLKIIVRKNQELEKIVISRTKDLHVTMDGLEKSRKEMGLQLAMMSRIVASISHDVQTPLRYISFASKTVPDLLESKDLQNIARVGTMIASTSDQMSTMLEQLLNFIKVQAYNPNTNYEKINLKKLVADKHELFKGVIEMNGSRFICELPTYLTVQSDLQLLSIIVHNLLDNASKYTVGGVINISQRTTENTTELIISNTGKGIPPHTAAIINAEYTGQTGEDYFKPGTSKGLGLLIVKEIASLLNITISVDSNEQTSFHLLFTSN